MSTIPVMLALVASVLLVDRADAQRQVLNGRVFTDKTVGLRISIPSGWLSLPIHIHERRVIGWFQSAESYRGDPRKGDTTKSSRAVMKIVRLDKPVRRAARLYDYNYWLKKTQKIDTYKASSEPGVAHGDVPVVKWDVRIAGADIDRRRNLTWVFEAEKQCFAVEFRFLEEHFESLRGTAIRALKSLRFVPATMQLEPPFVAAPFVRNDWSKLPLLERHRRRSAIGKAHEAEVLSQVLPGWSVQKSQHFLVVSHTDAKTTRHVHDLVSAFRGWLDARFGSLSDEYPIRIIIRICGNASEYYAYRSGAWRVDYNFGSREIVMADDGGVLNMKDVLWRVYCRYMLDVAPEVYFNQPVWFAQALRGLMTRARLKGRRLVFPSSREELSIFDELRRTGRARIWTAAELLGHPDFGYVPDKSPMDNDLILMARVLFRFIEGPGQRCKAIQGRDFITTYVKAIQKLARELDAADADVLVWDGEETIAAMYDARRAAAQSLDEKKGVPARPPGFSTRWTSYLGKVRARRVEFAKKLFARTCAWSPKEWAWFERSFERFCRSSAR